jgi:hypothetical protein
LLAGIVAFCQISDDAGDAIHTRLRAVINRMLNG